ncbi:hypothetical protein [Flavobacterium sp. KMS]|uniref:hypothetical protein n=1 Tax=Flavobacterium sp. KMS TaxID=1566023 RepID=UPI000A5D9F9B|nr:hypothetical protein [Flavobacterium sp. KMS]
MKNKLLPLFFVLASYSAYSQVGIGTTMPNSSSQLEVVADDKGILIPRIQLKNSTDVTTIVTGNVNSLLVFNTATIADVKPGYYYWYENKWNRIVISGENNGMTGGAGVPGKDGVSPPEGTITWIDTESGFIYIKDADGNWVKVSGKDGVDGAAGLAGGAGVPGKDGVSPPQGATAWIDTETGIVYVKDADGNWVKVSGKDGKDGKGIASTIVDKTSGNLIITYSDGSTADLGKVIGEKGEPGLPPTSGAGTITGKGLIAVTNGVNNAFKNTEFSLKASKIAGDILQTVDNEAVWTNADKIVKEPWFNIRTKAGATSNEDSIYTKGWVGIGYDAPSGKDGEKLRVNGSITTVSSTYADYVFEDYFQGFSDIKEDYKFKKLVEIEDYIKTHKHLPGITPINELEKSAEGYSFNMSELSIQLLEKTEEIYLHIIEQNNAIIAKDKEIEKMNQRLERLEKLIEESSNSNK